MSNNNLRIASAFALRDISKSKMVLFLTITSLGLAYAVVLVSAGILSGFSESIKNGSIDSGGEITVYLEGDKSKEEIDTIEKTLDSIDNVAGTSLRSYGGLNILKDGAVVGTGYASIGLDPDREASATKIPSRVIEGKFLNTGNKKTVVIGQQMADMLKGKLYDNQFAKVGEKIVYVGSKGRMGEFEIVGIIDAKYFHPNWTNYFLKDEIEYLDYSRKNEEIVVKLVDVGKIEETKKMISENIPKVSVVTWEEREGYVLNLIDAMEYITGNITTLLIITTFILTTVFVFINVFQRKRQIGILKSMGASNNFVRKVYVMETILFSILSFGLGFLIFFLAYKYSSVNPMASLIGDIRVNFNPADLLLSFASLFVASIIGSIIPIYFATRVEIADVIRNST